jgi:ketosteroid isomerase-like protein
VESQKTHKSETEDTKTVLDAYEAFNNGNLEAMLGCLAPDVEWDESDLPARRPGVYRGHEGVKKLMAEYASLLNEIQIAID